MPVIGTLAGASARGLGGMRTFGPPPVLSNYFSLETQTLTSAQTSITFSSISPDYTHLQLRIIGRTTRTDYVIEDANLRINGDTNSNYTWQRMFSDPATSSTAVSFATSTSETFINSVAILGTNAAGANKFGAAIVDFIDYKNTNKFKTVKAITGVQLHGDALLGVTDFAELSGGVWRNTNAITSLTLITPTGTQFTANSQFALYGIK
jgi:hypothetical protein